MDPSNRVDRWAKGSLLMALAVAIAGLLLHKNGAAFLGGLLLAFGEAALVGGLADWFAVPPCSPIPSASPFRTVPSSRNRRRIVAEVRGLVENEWFAADARFAGTRLRLHPEATTTGRIDERVACLVGQHDGCADHQRLKEGRSGRGRAGVGSQDHSGAAADEGAEGRHGPRLRRGTRFFQLADAEERVFQQPDGNPRGPVGTVPAPPRRGTGIRLRASSRSLIEPVELPLVMLGEAFAVVAAVLEEPRPGLGAGLVQPLREFRDAHPHPGSLPCHKRSGPRVLRFAQ